MREDLIAIEQSWDKGIGEGRQEEETRSLARKYIEEHPDQFNQIQNLTEDQCVQAIDVLRDNPNHEFASAIRFATFGTEGAKDLDSDEQWFVVQVWLWAKFPPKKIGIALGATPLVERN